MLCVCVLKRRLSSRVFLCLFFRTFNRPHTNFTPAGTDVYKSPEAILGGKRDGRKVGAG